MAKIAAMVFGIPNYSVFALVVHCIARLEVHMYIPTHMHIFTAKVVCSWRVAYLNIVSI